MHRNRLPRRNSRRGSAIMEFALMATLFMLLLGGVMDFSRVYYISMQLNDAAMAGIQYSLISGDTTLSTIQSRATAAQPNLTGMSVTASTYCTATPTPDVGADGSSTTCTTSASTTRKYIQVATSIDYTLFSTYFALPGSMNLKGLAVVRVQ